MVKFGGPGRAKQTCMMRQCLQPMLPVTSQCVYCHLDGWRQTPVQVPPSKGHAHMDGPSALLECAVCYEIAHPDCVQIHAPNYQGTINDDLPNSWECPLCCKAGKNSGYKVSFELSGSQNEEKLIKLSFSSRDTSEPAKSRRNCGECRAAARATIHTTSTSTRRPVGMRTTKIMWSR